LSSIEKFKKVKFTPEEAMKVQKGSSGIALLIFNLGARWAANEVPIVLETGWAPGSLWTDAKNPAPKEIRSPDRPARRF
jgi:hypothetical protein